jgi:hypothetical protein
MSPPTSSRSPFLRTAISETRARPRDPLSLTSGCRRFLCTRVDFPPSAVGHRRLPPLGSPPAIAGGLGEATASPLNGSGRVVPWELWSQVTSALTKTNFSSSASRKQICDGPGPATVATNKRDSVECYRINGLDHRRQLSAYRDRDGASSHLHWKQTSA